MGSPEASQIRHGANDDTSTNQDWQQGAKWFKRHRMDNTQYLNPHSDLTLEQHFENFFTTLTYNNAQPHQIKLQKVQQLKDIKVKFSVCTLTMAQTLNTAVHNLHMILGRANRGYSNYTKYNQMITYTEINFQFQKLLYQCFCQGRPLGLKLIIIVNQ